MPLKRRQSKARNLRITAEALDLFRQLQKAGTDAKWWAIHNQLHAALGCKPWQWPCVEPPDAERNYPIKTEAIALWGELEQAADAALL